MDSITKKTDVARAQESKPEVNTGCEPFQQISEGSKNDKSFGKKHTSTLKSCKRHKNRNAKQNAEKQDSSSTESSSSVDSSLLLDSYVVEQHFCKDRTIDDSLVYTKNHPAISSTPCSVRLPESSLVTDERKAFRAIPSSSHCRKEPMGSENTSLPSATSVKEKSKFPSSYTKRHVTNIQERIMHRKHQNSASDNSEFERSIIYQQYMSPTSDSLGQYVRPPLIGQSSDILIQSDIKQSTSESSETMTSSTSAESTESRDSLTYKVESLIGDEIVVSRSKIRQPNLSSLVSTSVTPLLPGRLLHTNISSEINPPVLSEHQKESVLSQKYCDLFSEEELHSKREFADAVRPPSMADTSSNFVAVHSQLSEQKQMVVGQEELSQSCGQGFAEKKASEQSFPKSAWVVQCSEPVDRSSVREGIVMSDNNNVVMPNEAVSEDNALSSGQFLSDKEDTSSHHESGEYSSSDIDVRAKSTPSMLTTTCSVKSATCIHSSHKELISCPSNNQDLVHLAQDTDSSKDGVFSSSGADSNGELSTIKTSTTERMKQSAALTMLTGTNTVSCGPLIAISSYDEIPPKGTTSLASSSEGCPVQHVFTSGSGTHSSGVKPVTISLRESLPGSNALSDVSNNVQSSVLLSSYSKPSHLSVNSSFPPNTHVATNSGSVNRMTQSSRRHNVVPDSPLPILSSDINCVSKSLLSVTAPDVRSTVIDTSSSDYIKKENISLPSTLSMSTTSCVTNSISHRLSTATVLLANNASVSGQAPLFTGSFSDSSAELSLIASNYSPAHQNSVLRSASDSENIVKKGSFGRHILQNLPPSYQCDENKFEMYSAYNFRGFTRSSEHPTPDGKQNKILQKTGVLSSRGTSATKNISESDNFDQHKFHNLKRQVTGSSSDTSSSGRSSNGMLSQKSLSDQEAERSISEITVSAESIQTIISAPRKSSNADTEAEISDESKNGHERVCDEDVHIRTTRTEGQHSASFVSSGFDSQLLNCSDKTSKHQPLRHGAACRNEANVDESEKSGYQSDHRESPMSVSSLASSKRLEWDNGADIGYETAPGMLSNLERLRPSDFALLFRSDPEGGALSNKNKTPSNQQTSTHNQLLTSAANSATSSTSVKNTSYGPPHSPVYAVPSTSDERISNRKNEHRLSSSTSDEPSSSAKHTCQSRFIYASKEFNFYDMCIQTEPKYFTKEAGVQAKMSLHSEGSLSSSVCSTSSGNTVKVPVKNKKHKLRHAPALASSDSARSQFHLHASGQPSHPYHSTHEGLKETLLKNTDHRDHVSSSLSDVSFSTGTLSKENITGQHFQHSVENSEKNYENSSEEEPELYSEHTKYFTDISNLRLQFPYPQQFLPSNISSVLVFDENSAYPEFLPDGADISELGDNVVFLRSGDNEQLLSDQTDIPHIRWYPVSGRSNSQEIRHAATQTAVSYIAEQDPEVYVDSQSERSQINNSSNTISSAQVSESESLDYLSCNQPRVRKYSDSGKENILPSDIQHSHYGTSESHTVLYEMRSNSAVPHLSGSGENHRIFYCRPLTSEETVPKSLISPPPEQQKFSSTTEKNAKDVYFHMNQGAKLVTQSHDALPQYEFQTLNYGDNQQPKNYASGVRSGETSFHYSPTSTGIPSGRVAHGSPASSWNNTQQVLNERNVSNIVPPSEILQFQSGSPVETVHYKVLKFLPKERGSGENYGDNGTCQNTLVCLSQNDDGQSSELESSLGQTQTSTKVPSHDNSVTQKENEKSAETSKSIPESTQKFASKNPPTVSHSLDETLHFQHISDWHHNNYKSKESSMYLPDERRENHRSLHGGMSEKSHNRIGGVGGNVPSDQNQFVTDFSTSGNSVAVTAYTNAVSQSSLGYTYPEEAKSRTDLESHLHLREASVLREGTLDLQTDVESTALTSMSQSETAESTHTGSDDAVPPKFPPEALGSRTEPVAPSPGIYGIRKFTQKYGHMGLKKFPSDSNLYDSKYSGELDSHYGRTSNAITSIDTISDQVKDSKKTLQPSSNVNTASNTSSEHKIGTSNKAGVNQNVKNVVIEESSVLSRNAQARQYQTNSAQNENVGIPQDNVIDSHLYSKSESSDTATVSISSEYQLPREKSYEDVETSVLLSDDPVRGGKDSYRIASEPKSHVAQKAKLEIGKLGDLVNRQKKNYLRRLQLEIDRLTRLEDLVAKHTSKYSSFSNSSLSSNGNADQTIPKYVSTEDIVDKVLQELGQPQEPAISYESETSGSSVANGSAVKYSKMTFPKHRNVKIQVSLGDVMKNRYETTAPLKSRTKDMLGNEHVQMKDFGQNYPTPVSSEHNFTKTKSVGIQASDSLLNSEDHSKSDSEKVRLFISLEGAQKKEKCKTSSSIKLSGSSELPKISKSNTRVRIEIPPSIAWCVSHRRSDWRRNHPGTHSRDFSGLSLQDAFHRNCGHLIRRSQARLMRITKLAELRSRLTALALEKDRFRQASHHRIACLKNTIYPLRRHFTHKEIRLQTEKIYKKLPEVVELKEKKKRYEMYRTNRLMAEIYKKKLQEQVLKGKVNWTISQTCLTT